MTNTAADIGDPEGEGPSPDIEVRVTLPEEFLGATLSDIQSRQGQLTRMDAGRKGRMTLYAVLPSAQFDSFRDDLAASTQGRTVVERL